MWARRFLVCACVVALGSSCIEDQLEPCGELLCPAAYVCTPGGCATPESAAACAALVDGDACLTQTIAEGTCFGGSCHQVSCGNAITDGAYGEVCDDGNQQAMDGCSADCRSAEVCGNQVIDVLGGEMCDDGLPGLSSDGCTSTCELEVETWREVTEVPIGGRTFAASTYDERLDRIVLFGGRTVSARGFDDTWEHDGERWERRTPPTSPPSRWGASMAYDPIRRRTLMFGGTHLAVPRSDLWAWDGITWTELTPAVSPPPRVRAAMAFDVSAGTLVLAGGLDRFNMGLFDTWTFDGTAWTPVGSSLPNTPSTYTQMAYDPVNQSNVLVSTGGVPQTYLFTGTGWRIGSNTAPNRDGAGIAVDRGSNRVVMFGSGGTVGGNQTHVWNGSSWTQLSPAVSPPGRGGSALARFRNRVIVFGGASNGTYRSDTWSLVGTTWTEVTVPEIRIGFEVTLTTDPVRGRIVIVGAEGAGNVAEWDGQRLLPAPSPDLPRLSHGAAYDEARRNLVVFGGVEGTNAGALTAETLTYDGVAWTKKAVAGPPVRYNPALAYDAARQRVVLFGGHAGAGQLLDDTWEWDGSGWTMMSPAVRPPFRTLHAMAYDRKRERVVMHGGLNEDGLQAGDTWEWDGTTWLRTTDMAPPQERHTLVYDPLRQRVVMAAESTHLEIWEYDGATWIATAPLSRPPLRSPATTAYDPIRKRLVMLGGLYEDGLASDVWARSFESVTNPGERCDSAGLDTDGDGLAGCADPDCFGRCAPLCAPATPCDPAAPHCGDGVCGAVEDYLICPMDCAAP